MTIEKDIPSYLNMGDYRAIVKYHGQTPTCRMCDSKNHMGKDCPSLSRRVGLNGVADHTEEEASRNLDSSQNNQRVDRTNTGVLTRDTESEEVGIESSVNVEQVQEGNTQIEGETMAPVEAERSEGAGIPGTGFAFENRDELGFPNPLCV